MRDAVQWVAPPLHVVGVRVALARPIDDAADGLEGDGL
jgi:hypothetical protein